MNINYQQTPADVVQNQHLDIRQAIELLQADLEAMTDEVGTAPKSWADVSKLSRAADLSRFIIEAYEN